jgi:hypothetical protein
MEPKRRTTKLSAERMISKRTSTAEVPARMTEVQGVGWKQRRTRGGAEPRVAIPERMISEHYQFLGPMLERSNVWLA